MADLRTDSIAFSKSHRDDFLMTLNELLSIPSVSTDTTKTEAMIEAAQWLAGQLTELGMEKVNLYKTPKNPIVYGEWIKLERKPTILIYGHYDVQPADPIELWHSQPFTPTRRGDNLYARGASDMKGQILAVIDAVESIIRSGRLPVNIKWLIEGEEEIGSPNLEDFISEHKDLLKSDYVLNPDNGMLGADDPSITYTLRGLAYFELRVFGPATDLHSGIFGGVIHNPANALAELIAGMHDADGKVTLPGFYSKVVPLNQEERLELNRLPMDDKRYLEQTGAPGLHGEKGYTAIERATARPTLDVNGLLSGFTGSGSKTVIPAWAMAKISMRLVPEQDPKEVHAQLVEYLKANAPEDIRWELTQMAGGTASISDRNSAGVRALEAGMETTWGRKPYFKREGGSVPVVTYMKEHLGIESLLTGFGLPDDNLHAPNEKLHLPTWYRGIESLIHFFFNMAEIK